MSNKIHMISRTLPLLIGGLLLVQESFAQQNDATQSEGDVLVLEEIIVTATRTERLLQDVPIAVSAVTDVQLDNSNIDSVEALGDLLPSVHFNQSTGDINSSIYIRGIGTSVFSSAVEPSVSFVLDGVVLGRQGQGLQDLVDIERVEVLRGPQSTLFGKNASAGVINVITKDPTEEFDGTVSLLLAEGGEIQVRGSISGALSDSLGMRVTAYSNQRDGHIENIVDGRDLNEVDSQGARVKLRYEPNDSFALQLTADYRDSDEECCLYTLRDLSTATSQDQAAAVLASLNGIVPGEENRQTNADAPIFNRSEQSGVALQADWTFDNSGKLTSITAFREWDYENNLDVDGTTGGPNGVATPGVIQLNVNNGETSTEQFTQELRYAGSLTENLDAVVGAYYFNLDLDRQFQRRLSAFVPAFNTSIFQSGIFNGTVETTNVSVFGELDYSINERLSLIAGLRYLDEELKYTAFRDPEIRLEDGDFALGGAAGTFADIDSETSDTAVTGRAGISYDFSDDVTGYATYSRGYKGQAFNVAFTVLDDAQPIEEEVSDAYEVGLKAFLFNQKLEINSALFLTDYDNYQAQAAVPGELTAILINAGEVRTSGFETEFKALLSPNFSLSGGLTVIDGEILRFQFGPCYTGQTEAQGCVNGAQDLGGSDLPDVADVKYNLTGRYERPITESLKGYLQLAYIWQDDIQYSLSQDPETIQEAYGLANLSFGVIGKEGSYQLNFFVNNLFDESFTTNQFRDALVTGAISQYIPRNAERYIGGSLKINF